jgi:hypothetical protein
MAVATVTLEVRIGRDGSLQSLGAMKLDWQAQEDPMHPSRNDTYVKTTYVAEKN